MKNIWIELHGSITNPPPSGSGFAIINPRPRDTKVVAWVAWVAIVVPFVEFRISIISIADFGLQISDLELQVMVVGKDCGLQTVYVRNPQFRLQVT